MKKNAYRAKLKSFTKSSYQIGRACAHSSFKQSKSKSIHTTVADPQFPSREEGVYQPIIWQKNVHQKLHENVRNWTGVGGAQGTRVHPWILHCIVSLSRLFKKHFTDFLSLAHRIRYGEARAKDLNTSQ